MRNGTTKAGSVFILYNCPYIVGLIRVLLCSESHSFLDGKVGPLEMMEREEGKVCIKIGG